MNKEWALNVIECKDVIGRQGYLSLSLPLMLAPPQEEITRKSVERSYLGLLRLQKYCCAYG